MKKIFYILLCFVLITSNLFSQENPISATIEGQAIGWTNFNFANDFANQWGGRYIPELSLEYNRNKDWKIDGEFSANAYGVKTYQNENWTGDSDLKPYRSWLRFSNEQFELRAGLQKINFGSAAMLRPLMWFDEIDPRDPLQLTDGVYGLLARYYFLNNANVWLWGLYGNSDPRGWDYLPGNKKLPEYGGRIQLPLYTGEIAFSYHHRNIREDSLDSEGYFVNFPEMPQDKFGIDGKWDLGVGVWFEYVLKKNGEGPAMINKWENQVNFGMDFTFGIGNGLNVQAEHLLWMAFQELYVNPRSIKLIAINLTYPLSLSDMASVILFYNWEDEDFYKFINIGRIYDNLSIYIMAYWNPEKFNIYQNLEGANLFSGKGIQLMLVYNH